MTGVGERLAVEAEGACGDVPAVVWGGEEDLGSVSLSTVVTLLPAVFECPSLVALQKQMIPSPEPGMDGDSGKNLPPAPLNPVVFST